MACLHDGERAKGSTAGRMEQEAKKGQHQDDVIYLSKVTLESAGLTAFSHSPRISNVSHFLCTHLLSFISSAKYWSARYAAMHLMNLHLILLRSLARIASVTSRPDAISLS